jgi:signal transduction histidine kinase
MRLGLELKLILCFMSVLTMAIGVTCLVFAQETHERLSDIMGEQTRQMATALSLASERSVRAGDWPELNRMAQDLLKSRNILFVGYLDSNAHAKTLASRDLDFGLANLRFNSQALMQVTRRQSATLGEYVLVVAPILSSPTKPSPASQFAETAQPPLQADGGRLLGYVAVGVSQAREQAQIDRVHWIVTGSGCLMVVGALPVAYLLVHRIFLPIRQLVQVTKQITKGDLDARVEIHRPDVIGDLARSFDEMVMWVKQQREDLAQANEQLAEANRDLEQKVEQRTAQLETANMRLAAEIAEKEEFLRAVSHDLNAPLRNISGMATMLLMKYRDDFDEDVVHRLERIKTNVDVETDLIAELLELSRIKTRRQKMEPVNVEVIVEELKNIFESDLRMRSIELIVDTPLPMLIAERARIRQVFQNLIDNAVKYMGDDTKRQIHIGCEMRMSEAEFYVQDSGIGIDGEDLDRIFFVFRRGKSMQVQNIAGKGVGLSSVKSIVETYNGKIWVNSQVGQGSTFRFTINGKFVMQPQQPKPGGAESVAA